MKYNAGDKVAIRRELQPGDQISGGYIVTEGMCMAAMTNNYVGTIVEVIPESHSYRLDIHNQPWWESWMFKGLTDFEFCSKEVLNFLEEM